MNRLAHIFWFCLISDGVSAFVAHRGRQGFLLKTSLAAGDGNPPPFDSYFNPISPATAPPPPENPIQPPFSAPAPSATGDGVATGDPISTLDLSQKDAMSELLSAVSDLVFKAELSQEGEGIQGSTMRAYDAPGASNVAWLADLCIPGKLSSFTLFNGPLTDIPHILSRCCLIGDSLELSVDVRPRAYGAYEMIDASGNYPGPEQLGRKAFEYSGARNDFFNKFANDEIKSLLDPSQFEGASERATSEFDKTVDGPLAVHLTMPNTAGNVDRIGNIKSSLVSSWIRWSQEDEHQHRPGAPINSQYVYDAKYRQNAYLALRQTYTDYFGGSDGSQLAAAESGPLDEAYVGGGS